MPCTLDSRLLAYQYDPVEGLPAVDIYIMGKLASSIGPFPKR